MDRDAFADKAEKWIVSQYGPLFEAGLPESVSNVPINGVDLARYLAEISLESPLTLDVLVEVGLRQDTSIAGVRCIVNTLWAGDILRMVLRKKDGTLLTDAEKENGVPVKKSWLSFLQKTYVSWEPVAEDGGYWNYSQKQ